MATSPLFGWEEPDDTDLVKDGAAAIRTLGNAIDTSMGDLLGGTTGQVLSKNSNTNMDFTWVTSDDANAIQNTIVDAKGDLIGATAADTPARLAVGANDTVLTADSTAATGLKWATPASSSPLTTKGDLFTYSTANARLAIGGNYGFLTADSTATTGNKWNDGAWTTYSPTVTAVVGTATTVTVNSARYIRVGKLCVVETNVYVNNKGTASSGMRITLPFTAAAYSFTGSSMENSVIGIIGRNYIDESAPTYLQLFGYDGTTSFWQNGYGIVGTIAYEVA
jgi:hypothetical protein